MRFLEVWCRGFVKAAILVALIALLYQSAPPPKNPTCLVFQCYEQQEEYHGGNRVHPNIIHLERRGK